MLYIRLILSLIASIIGIILIIPGLMLMFPFWFVSLVAKMVAKFKPTLSTWEDIIEFDPELGWRSKPNIDAHMDVDGIYHITVGPDGWRGNQSLKKSDTIVIGDSFVCGQGTDDKNHFSNLTKHTQVKPIGAPGYGVVHYLLLLKNLSSDLKGKLVLWFVYTGNDYRESVRPSSYGYHFPFVFRDNATEAWEIQTSHIRDTKLPFHFEKGYKVSIPELADLFSKNYFSDYAYGAFEYLVVEAKKHCETHGAKFAVVTLPIKWCLDDSYLHKLKRHSGNPENFSLKYPDEQAGIICKRHGITFKAGSSEFTTEDFLPNDLHWSQGGNKKAAKIIDVLHKDFTSK